MLENNNLNVEFFLNGDCFYFELDFEMMDIEM